MTIEDRYGVPAVAVHTDKFDRVVRSVATTSGMPGLRQVFVPQPVMGKSARELRAYVDGKTVYLVDCRFDDSDVFLKQVQAWFAQHMPGVRTVFKQISSVYLKDDPTTWDEIKARGHAAIVGVGH